jgi:hypothetical protein
MYSGQNIFFAGSAHCFFQHQRAKLHQQIALQADRTTGHLPIQRQQQ